MSKKRYTCVSKGGEFEIVGTSSGAGPRKGESLIVYRDLKTGKLHHRKPENFAMRMQPVAEPEINAQLLAALETLTQDWVTPHQFDHPDFIAARAAIAAAKGEA